MPPGTAKPSNHPRRDIHPVAENVVLFNDHVAEVDADAEPDPPLLGHVGLAVAHSSLDLRGAPHGIYNARKFHQETVASIFYDPAPVLRDLRIDQFAEMRFEPFVRPLLIQPHQARVTCHIGGQDRGKAADRGHFAPEGKVP